MLKKMKLLLLFLCIGGLIGCKSFWDDKPTQINVTPPITPVEVQKDHTKASTTLEAINGNVDTALKNSDDIKGILNKNQNSEQPAKNVVTQIAPHNDNAILELQKSEAQIKTLKEQMSDIQTKHLKLTDDYKIVLDSNKQLVDSNKSNEEIIKKSKADYVALSGELKKTQVEVKNVKEENLSLKEKLEELGNIINNSLGKLAYVLIGFGCLCIVGAVLGFVFTPDKSLSTKAGVSGFLLVAAGGIVPSLVKAASTAAVGFFWVLVVILALYIVYNVYVFFKDEHIKKDLLQTATLLGTKAEATIRNQTDTINMIQSSVTKEYVDKMTKILGTDKMKDESSTLVSMRTKK